MPTIHVFQFAYAADSEALVESVTAIRRLYGYTPHTVINDPSDPVTPRAREYLTNIGVKFVDDSMDRIGNLNGESFITKLLDMYSNTPCDYIMKIDPDTIITTDIVQDLNASGLDAQWILSKNPRYRGLGWCYVLRPSCIAAIKASIAANWPADPFDQTKPNHREDSCLSMACEAAFPDRIQWIAIDGVGCDVFDWSLNPPPPPASYADCKRVTFGAMERLYGPMASRRALRNAIMRQFNGAINRSRPADAPTIHQ